jgi:hypothetical protein
MPSQLEEEYHVPDRSLKQRMDALTTANVIRTWRAGLKRDLKAGRVDVIDLLIDPPEKLETMKVFDLLLAAPKYGRVNWTRNPVPRLIGSPRF